MNRFNSHHSATFKTQSGALRHAKKILDEGQRFMIAVTPEDQYFVVAFNVEAGSIGYYIHNRISVVN